MEEARLLAAEKKQAKAEGKGKATPEPTPLMPMYVLKFNSPILPFAKFPLTHNKYIQEFLRMYESDKSKIT